MCRTTTDDHPWRYLQQGRSRQNHHPAFIEKHFAYENETFKIKRTHKHRRLPQQPALN
jgi:hypothetical protein